MGVLANHVPSIEQLKPGLVEVIEESGGSKQFFRRFTSPRLEIKTARDWDIAHDGRSMEKERIERHDG